MDMFKSDDGKGRSWENEWCLRFHWRTTCLLVKKSVKIWTSSVVWGRWSVLSYFSRSVCYRKNLTALYVREGAWDLLIIISSAELMKLQLASQIPLCVCINMLWWLHLSSILSWETFLLSLFKRERGGKLRISSQFSLGGNVFKMTGKPIWQNI